MVGVRVECCSCKLTDISDGFCHVLAGLQYMVTESLIN